MRPPKRRRKATPEIAPPDIVPSEIAPDEPEDSDPSEDERETGPLRRCAVTRARLPKDAMIRFVVGPDRRIVPDLAADLPGRGIWLSAKADVLEAACKKGAFARAARGQVVISPELVSEIRAALLRRIAETLGLARRAGQAISGFAKAREWMQAGRVGVVVQASDGSPDERARFLGAARATVPVVTPLDAAALGAMFGRDHAVHAVVAPGRLAERLRVESAKLAGLVGGNGTFTTKPKAPPGETMQDVANR